MVALVAVLRLAVGRDCLVGAGDVPHLAVVAAAPSAPGGLPVAVAPGAPPSARLAVAALRPWRLAAVGAGVACAGPPLVGVVGRFAVESRRMAVAWNFRSGAARGLAAVGACVVPPLVAVAWRFFVVVAVAWRFFVVVAVACLAGVVALGGASVAAPGLAGNSPSAAAARNQTAWGIERLAQNQKKRRPETLSPRKDHNALRVVPTKGAIRRYS